jgi:uncharacterized protein (DUF58 family)
MARRAFLLILLVYILTIAGLATLRGGLLALAVPLVLYLLVGLWLAPGPLRLEVQRTLSSERAAPELPVHVTLTVLNRGSDLADVVLQDVLPEGLRVQAGSNRHLLRLQSGHTFTCEYDVSGPRGYYGFSTVKVDAADPFGILHRQEEIPVPGQLFILPPVMRLHHVAIRPRRTNVYAGSIPARIGGPGVEFFGVREYQPGDPTHWINWMVSARHAQHLYSNEFEQERVADVGIVLDGRLRTNVFWKGQSLFEYSVQAAATLAETLLAQGNRVGLLLYGHFLQWTFPGYGKIQRERILQALARATPGDSLVFADLEHIPTRLFPPHSQIVLVSPLLSADYDVLMQLRTHSYQVMVVSPDPVSFELAHLPEHPDGSLAGRIIRLERQVLLNKLGHAGVQVLDWDVTEPFEKAGKAALGRPPVGLRAVGR